MTSSEEHKVQTTMHFFTLSLHPAILSLAMPPPSTPLKSQSLVDMPVELAVSGYAMERPGHNVATDNVLSLSSPESPNVLAHSPLPVCSKIKFDLKLLVAAAVEAQLELALNQDQSVDVLGAHRASSTIESSSPSAPPDGRRNLKAFGTGGTKKAPTKSIAYNAKKKLKIKTQQMRETYSGSLSHSGINFESTETAGERSESSIAVNAPSPQVISGAYSSVGAHAVEPSPNIPGLDRGLCDGDIEMSRSKANNGEHYSSLARMIDEMRLQIMLEERKLEDHIRTIEALGIHWEPSSSGEAHTVAFKLPPFRQLEDSLETLLPLPSFLSQPRM